MRSGSSERAFAQLEDQPIHPRDRSSRATLPSAATGPTGRRSGGRSRVPAGSSATPRPGPDGPRPDAVRARRMGSPDAGAGRSTAPRRPARSGVARRARSDKSEASRTSPMSSAESTVILYALSGSGTRSRAPPWSSARVRRPSTTRRIRFCIGLGLSIFREPFLRRPGRARNAPDPLVLVRAPRTSAPRRRRSGRGRSWSSAIIVRSRRCRCARGTARRPDPRRARAREVTPSSVRIGSTSTAPSMPPPRWQTVRAWISRPRRPGR
jgi:hypothetical protein